jgi:hypothetical protein
MLDHDPCSDAQGSSQPGRPRHLPVDRSRDDAYGADDADVTAGHGT